MEDLEAATLAIVSERSDYSRTIFEQCDDAHLHVHIDSLMYPVVLERPNHLKAGTVAYMRESWIFVAAKVSLQNPTISGAIEHRAPRFELTHPRGRFLRVQLGHPPVVHVLATAHRIGKMHLPVVAIVNIGQRGCDAALGHHGVRFTEKTFANHANRNASRGRLDCRAQSSAAGTDNQYVVLESFVLGHEIR
jgi:hypothetical protein